ncbi:MAG: hypothetical protein ACO3HJ_07965, partial [Methylophilaceae bacterium]
MVVKNLAHPQKEDLNQEDSNLIQVPSSVWKQNQSEENNLAYFAGVIEGEGCFFNSKNQTGRLYPTIQVEMTDGDVIHKLNDFFKGNAPFSRKRAEDRLRSYRFRIMGERALKIMFDIYNYMSARRKAKIDQVMREYCEYHANRVKYASLDKVIKHN